VIVCVPAVKEAVLKDAVVTPPALFTPTGLPALLPSIVNCTMPVGVPLPGAVTVTVALKVTLWPDTDGLTEPLTAVLVAALFTIWVRGVVVLLEKVVSPA
jgi:hypothetical protein